MVKGTAIIVGLHYIPIIEWLVHLILLVYKCMLYTIWSTYYILQFVQSYVHANWWERSFSLPLMNTLLLPLLVHVVRGIVHVTCCHLQHDNSAMWLLANVTSSLSIFYKYPGKIWYGSSESWIDLQFITLATQDWSTKVADVRFAV